MAMARGTDKKSWIPGSEDCCLVARGVDDTVVFFSFSCMGSHSAARSC